MPIAQRLRPGSLGQATLVALFLAAGLVIAMIGLEIRRAAPWQTPALLALHVLIGVWVLRHATPMTDIFMFQQGAAQAVLAGVNPYGILYPNPYRHDRLYGPGVVVDGVLQFGYPYPPLRLLLTLPAFPFGDIRYAHPAAMTGAGALIAYARPGRNASLGAAWMLLSPGLGLVLQRGATGPFVLLCLAATAFCAVRAPRWLPWATGLLLVSKQYVVLAVPALSLTLAVPSRRTLGRLLVQATALATVITLPWAIARPAGFIRSVVTLQFAQPIRADPLSFLPLLAVHDRAVSTAVTLATTLSALALAVWRCPLSPAGFAGALGLVYLVFFAFNQQAFVNYYSLVVGALAFAVALRRPA